MRISRWTLLWLLIVGLLVSIELGLLSGLINPYDIVTFFFIMVAALVVIAVLAIIGAIFLGIYISHRVLSTRDFTPFEQEMLRVADDVRKLGDKVDLLARRLEAEGGNPGPKR